MKDLVKKVAVGLATGGLVVQAMITPVLALDVQITGNGYNSDTDVDVDQSNSVDVDQNNDADINNDINIEQETGENDANDNTGGDVNVTTGNTTANVDVLNVANKNQASVEQCCLNNVDVNISGNGTNSDNNVDLNLDNDVDIDQDNDADIDNDVNVEQETGENDANDNTGGSVSINTGNTDATVTLSTVANANSARVSGGQNGGGVISAWILGNGSDSDNDINIDLNNDVNVDQNNDADINNDVNVEQETGENDANDNTGGDVAVLTGDTNATVEVDNLVNFNGADIEGCGCLTDLLAKIAGNGTYSDNEINFDADSDLDVDQDNDANLDNDVNVEQETGENDVKDNTGDPDGDPSVETGNTDVNVSASNKANVNTFGDLGDWWEDVDFDFDFDFDLSGLLSLLLGGGLS